MKIQLDTVNKTIKIEEQVNIDEFIKVIKKLLPDNLWKEFSLETGVITYWNYPYYIETWPKHTQYPWYDGTSVLCGSTTNIDSSDYDMNNSDCTYKTDVPHTYCIEVN